MSNFDIYNTASDLQLEPEAYVAHLNKNSIYGPGLFNRCSLKIKNAQYQGELIITDDIEIPNARYHFGVLKTNFHMSSVEIEVASK